MNCESILEWTNGIPLAKAGAATDRDRLIASCLPMVVQVARRYYGRDKVTNDVLQEGAFALIRAAEKYQPSRAKFTTFAWWCIRSHFAQQHAREATVKRGWEITEVQLSDSEPTSEVSSAGDDIQDLIHNEDQLRQVRRALRCMQPRDKQFVRMHFFDGLAYREIARLVGVSRERVRQRIHRALERARDVLSRPVRVHKRKTAA